MFQNNKWQESNTSEFLRSPSIGNSQAGFPAKERVSKLQNLVPMTIAQILSSSNTDDVLHLGDLDVHMVTVVGLVHRMEQQTTHVVYELDDMSSGSRLKVQHWLEEDAMDRDTRSPMLVNTYARAWGTVKSMGGERHFVAFNIRPIKSLDEITFHMLQVMQAKKAVFVDFKQQPDTSRPSSTFGNNNNNQANTSPMEVDGGYNYGFNKSQKMVYEVLRMSANSSSDGMHIDLLISEMRAKNMSASEVREVVMFLNAEGHIYTTTDENHYKITDT